jgi:hypothetical protein
MAGIGESPLDNRSYRGGTRVCLESGQLDSRFHPYRWLVDDALVVGACLAMVEQDLQKYKNWKMEQT